MSSEAQTRTTTASALLTVGLSTAALWVALMPGAWPLGLWTRTAIAALIACAAALASGSEALSGTFEVSSRTVWQGLVVGVLMSIATHALYPPLSTLVPALVGEGAALYTRLDAPPGRLAAVPIIVLVVVAEELVWRGVAFAYLCARLPRLQAWLLCTLIYALPQLGSGSWLLPLLALGCGAVWTWQRLATGGLVAPLITHLAWDVAVLVVWPLG